MRIRTIKPAFWTSEDIAALTSDTTRLLFIGLWNYVDDDGRGVDNAALIRAALFPLDDRALASVDQEIRALSIAGLICRYTVEGRRYLHVCSFDKHQVINRRTLSTLPAPPFHEPYVSTHGALSEPSLLEGKGREGEMEKEGEGKPSVEQQDRPALELVPATVSPSGDRVERIFNAWIESTGKKRAHLDAKRRRLIVAALKTYPETDLIDAVRGWRNSPHHAGQNDNGTIYNELTLLLRDAAHIEKFRDLERGHQIGAALAPQLSRNTQFIAARIADARAKEITQ